ncbi:MAG: DUF342 domain-containing protein [Candidatus Riflebacteria bacterium]|nr:DUF342 domain-containing protein [Candidatus Riflebacteria bacterium]
MKGNVPPSGAPSANSVRQPLKLGNIATGLVYHVTLNQDKTEAYLSVEAYPEELDPFEFLDQIKKGICSVVTEGLVSKFWDVELDECIRRRKIFFERKIAQATPATPGIHAVVEYKIPRPTKEFLIRPDGTCDFKNRDLFKSALEGETILIRTPPVEGIPGKDVFGASIPPAPARDFRIVILKNASSSIEEGREIIRATCAGQTVIEDRGSSIVVKVVSVLVVPQDVDYSTGNINFKGSVEIKGSVLSGFSVVATGNIIVNGLIEPEAKVTSGGDILVKKGIRGTGRSNDTSEVKSFGNVQALYAENARITAEGDMLFRSVMNCRLCANGSLFVERALVGGTVTVLGSVEAGEIGNVVSARTLIHCGVSHTTINRINLIAVVLTDMRKKLAEVEKNLVFVTRRNQSENAVTREKIISALKKRFDSLREQIQKLELKKSDLAVTLLDENKVSVSSTLFFPGTVIQLINTKQIIDRETKATTYYRKMPEETIEFRSYQPDKRAKSPSVTPLGKNPSGAKN